MSHYTVKVHDISFKGAQVAKPCPKYKRRTAGTKRYLSLLLQDIYTHNRDTTRQQSSYLCSTSWGMYRNTGAAVPITVNELK